MSADADPRDHGCVRPQRIPTMRSDRMFLISAVDVVFFDRDHRVFFRRVSHVVVGSRLRVVFASMDGWFVGFGLVSVRRNLYVFTDEDGPCMGASSALTIALLFGKSQT